MSNLFFPAKQVYLEKTMTYNNSNNNYNNCCCSLLFLNTVFEPRIGISNQAVWKWV
jgi:hypothetical protein